RGATTGCVAAIARQKEPNRTPAGAYCPTQSPGRGVRRRAQPGSWQRRPRGLPPMCEVPELTRPPPGMNRPPLSCECDGLEPSGVGQEADFAGRKPTADFVDPFDLDLTPSTRRGAHPLPLFFHFDC
ncbi:unnamed protein product, partial [Ectocarpus sp. 13 AM-2016]